MPANLNRKQQREIKAVVERAILPRQVRQFFLKLPRKAWTSFPKWRWQPKKRFYLLLHKWADRMKKRWKQNHFSLKCCRTERCFPRIVKKNLKPQGSRNRPSKRQRKTQELSPRRKVSSGIGLCRWAIYRENKNRMSADGIVCFCDWGIKGGQGGTPLPTTSLQTKSESVIVGYTHSKNVV